MVLTSFNRDNNTCNTASMSTLSAQMKELEKKLGTQQKLNEIKTSASKLDSINEQPLLVSDDMDSTCLRAPPPSLRSDSDLEQYFRVHVESRCKHAAEIMTPATEPIQQASDKQSAIQREYDIDTWKMYHLIQSSRRPNGVDSNVIVGEEATIPSSGRKERRLSDVSERGNTGVSFQDCNDDDNDLGIFELELDS